MSVSQRLLGKLHETLGKDATEDLVTWMHQVSSYRDDMREAMRADFAELRQEMNVGFAQLREQLGSQMHGVETRLNDRIQAVENKLEQRSADLIRWSFVFWVGAVAAIAALAGVLRN
jgi:hypothetical protein